MPHVENEIVTYRSMLFNQHAAIAEKTPISNIRQIVQAVNCGTVQLWRLWKNAAVTIVEQYSCDDCGTMQLWRRPLLKLKSAHISTDSHLTITNIFTEKKVWFFFFFLGKEYTEVMHHD